MTRTSIRLIDVGAAGGLAEPWNRLDVEVVRFEPDPRSREDGHAVALADRSGGATLYLARKPENSSLLRPNRAFLERFPEVERFDIVEETQIQTARLDDFGLRADAIKIDVQGSELAVLRGAERTLEGIDAVEVEVAFAPVYEGQAPFAELDAWLQARGFLFATFSHLYYWRRLNGLRQCVFGDALYLRDSRAAEGFLRAFAVPPTTSGSALPVRERLARLLYRAYVAAKPAYHGWAQRYP